MATRKNRFDTEPFVKTSTARISPGDVITNRRFLSVSVSTFGARMSAAVPVRSLRSRPVSRSMFGPGVSPSKRSRMRA
jgi:hypothetical protein